MPVNGPKLSRPSTAFAQSLCRRPPGHRLLYEVHGYEIFQLGLFNSDPHAGNAAASVGCTSALRQSSPAPDEQKVFMMPDGKLGLIDYGACSRSQVQALKFRGTRAPPRLSREQRTNVAKMLVVGCLAPRLSLSRCMLAERDKRVFDFSTTRPLLTKTMMQCAQVLVL